MVKELLSIPEKANLTVSKISVGLVLVAIFCGFFFSPSQIVSELGTHPDSQTVLILLYFMFFLKLPDPS